MNTRMLTTLRGALLAGLLTLWISPAVAAFWTTPDPVVAGQPTRVVFSSWSYGGQPEVEVQVEEGRIVLVQSNLCGVDACFSARVPATVEAMLPPLAPGSYTVELVWAGEDDAPVEAAILDVQAIASSRVLPADGFWTPVGQPGSGLFLERRGDLLALSMYSYLPGAAQPFWLLGTGTYASDSAPLLMRAYQDGDCLGCADHRAPVGPGGSAALRLRFESARRAWLDVFGLGNDAVGPALISLPYGVDYIPHTLTDTVDAEFGPLPLPDLRGRWVFAIEGAESPDDTLSVRLDGWTLDGDAIFFSGNVAVECRSATEAQRAGCTFRPNLWFTPPPPEPLNTFYGPGWFVPLGDIQEDRMRGVLEADGQTWRVQGFRTAPPPAGSAND